MTCNLISPESAITIDDVRYVQVPGAKGSFGILPRHAHLVSSLVEGRVRVRNAKSETIYVLSQGGFVEVKDNVVSIIAESIAEEK
ncbi:MAG: F0F1 ATP synthase subunit epsilon [Bacteroidales bacterium]|nr:F0F1 ATP synthase subunit epsilon [Bacteroidales bacterium]